MKNNINQIFFMGLSGSGKTTLIEKIIPEISEISIFTIKFMHHAEFTVDPSYKDTRRHRNSGSVYTVCYAPNETILLINEEKRGTMLDFDELYNKLPPVDLVLVEGLNHPPKGSTIILILKNPNDFGYYKDQLAH
ncbi:MAG: Molybdopterin-guanine dinucleotide biosynthesis adapter protein, partial [Candidatus Heimdallarchaeota archaeon LC_2]